MLQRQGENGITAQNAGKNCAFPAKGAILFLIQSALGPDSKIRDSGQTRLEPRYDRPLGRCESS